MEQNNEMRQVIKEVLFDYSAETIEFADEISERIIKRLSELHPVNKTDEQAAKETYPILMMWDHTSVTPVEYDVNVNYRFAFLAGCQHVHNALSK